MDKTVKIVVIIFLCCAAAAAAVLMIRTAGTGNHTSVVPGAPQAMVAGTTTPAPNATGTGGTTTCTQVTITQTDGTPVTLPSPARATDRCERGCGRTVNRAWSRGQIVGVTDSTLSVPYIMDKIPNATSIGNWETPNVEQILALHPDAVISSSSSSQRTSTSS